MTAPGCGPNKAPGPLDLVRRFENTVELPDGPDELDSLDHAEAWCRSEGLVPACDGAQLQRLRDFREAIRDLLFANNGEGDLRAAWGGLQSFLPCARLGLKVDPQGGLQLDAAGKEGDSAIAALLAIVYESLRNGSWSRLRACRKRSCGFAYYDQTKNGSRAWCSMATCGNQAKAQRRRQRERSLPLSS